MCVLRIIGRGADCDSCAKITGISRSVVYKFYHTFLDSFSQLALTYCSPPEGEHLRKHTEVYARLGYPGAVASNDGTHVRWAMCPAEWRRHFIGKEGYPSIGFDVTCSAWAPPATV